MKNRNREGGYVVSAEVLLIALVLVIGLATGWAKLRDQTLAELKDFMAAVDTYNLGAAPLWQTGGTRWIVNGAIVGPQPGPPVTERWVDAFGNTFSASAAEEVPGSPGTYRSKDGFLVYGSTAGESSP